jgi:hypothetical protein
MEGFDRPEIVILPEGAAIPNPNLIRPAPNQFTHQLARSQPYYFNNAQQDASAGEFPVDTKVVLLRYNGGRYCRVVDGRGIYVELEYDSLKTLK